jgi:hypothetical protein
MALRDAQLIPSLESSAHINLAFAAQFIPKYFARKASEVADPPSLTGEAASAENSYLMQARSGAINSISFAPYLKAYGPLIDVPNVRLFAVQAKAFRLFARRIHPDRSTENQLPLALGQCMATIAYGQLIAENARCLGVASELVSVIFHLLVADLAASALALAPLPELDARSRSLIQRMIVIPRTASGHWDFVADRIAAPSR